MISNARWKVSAGNLSKIKATMPDRSSNDRSQVRVRRVDEVETLDELFTHCFPAFGGAFLRRIYTILDRAIGTGCPLTLAVSGPVTVSGQHQAWLIPLLEAGWIAYLSTTDAACYHDGHRSLDAHRDPVFEVPIWGDDGALRDEHTIRVTDMAFSEDVLLDQDKFLSAVLLRPEFQRRMTGTELHEFDFALAKVERHLLDERECRPSEARDALGVAEQAWKPAEFRIPILLSPFANKPVGLL